MSKSAEKIKRKVYCAQNALDVPPGLMASSSMEIVSNREAVFSGPVLVTEYDENSVSIRSGEVTVRFSGDGMCISCLNTDGIKITGELDKIEFSKEASKW